MTELGAIILAGGQSRRMGHNKALLRLAPGGPRLIELAVAAARSLTPRIFLSANDPAIYAWLGLPCIPDAYPGAGPLAGLAAGLVASGAEWNLLLGCDMPFVQPALLRSLAGRIGPDIDAVIPCNEAGEPEPLCALYRQTCLPIIQARLGEGDYAMRGWLRLARVQFLTAADLRAADPELRSFANLNAPEDLP